MGGPDDFLSEFRPPMTTESHPWAPYVSIDLETTGLDPDYCQILEFGAVIDNWHSPVEELPRFHRYIKPTHDHDGQPFVYGQPYALALNAEILKRLASNDPALQIIAEGDLGQQFAAWLVEHKIDPKRVNASGKNFASFDLQFLRHCPEFSEHVTFRHRSIDPAVLFWRPDTDDALPDTKTCLTRADLEGRVAHTAVEDCISVIQLIRRGVRKCELPLSLK
jgi:DNA polymerase III epsilon subunit-like protein